MLLKPQAAHAPNQVSNKLFYTKHHKGIEEIAKSR